MPVGLTPQGCRINVFLMTAAAIRIENEIRGLPLEDQLALHTQILVLIYKDEPQPLDPAFREEILRRIEEIDAGEVQGSDPFEALRRM